MVSEKKVSSTKRVEKKFNKEEASSVSFGLKRNNPATKKVHEKCFVTDSIQIRKDRYYANSTSVLTAQY